MSSWLTHLSRIAIIAPFFIVSHVVAENDSSIKKPNFVWLVSEDSGREYFNLYDKQGAKTPNIERLAEEGIVFNNALSNAPVCSVARSTLATGAYAPRIGVQYHRAWQYVDLPQGLIPISKMLMDDGYYVSNNYKTDYNFNGTKTFWHETGVNASWKKRNKNQPFFFMQTFQTTHSSRLHFPAEYVETKKTQHNPDIIDLPPYYPNTKTFRYTYARYLDKIQEMDQELGKVVDQLEADGLLENTFIFFFGDHGGPLPGSKGYLFDRGLHTPLVVRIPKNFRYLLSQDMQGLKNARADGIVNFIDFAPTLAKLAGLDASAQHDGRAFLGNKASLAELNKRDFSFSYADRFDERSSLLRSLHQGNFQYIRRYEPFTPDSLFNAYRARQPAYQEWASLFKAGKLNAVQANYFEPKPAEALYDLVADPHEITNLATDPAYRVRLLAMRAILNSQIKGLPDVGFYPESYVLSQSKSDVARFGQQHKKQISALVDIADLQLEPFKKVQAKLRQLLRQGSTWQQYWALIVASHFGVEAARLSEDAELLINSNAHTLVKARAIQFLATAGNFDPTKILLELIAQADTDIEVIEVLNIAAQLKDAEGFTIDVPKRENWVKPRKGEPDFFHKRSKYNMISDRLDFLKGKYD